MSAGEGAARPAELTPTVEPTPAGSAEPAESAPTEGRSIAWTTESPAGPLDITINLSKPEKDPRAIAAAATGNPASAEDSGAARRAQAMPLPPDHGDPSCLLCWVPDDDCGGAARLCASGEPVYEIALGGEPWAWWYSPYGYFPEHLIVASATHRPMAIGPGTIARLLDFADQFPQWFIGSNAELPIVGGSILNHDHFQGGRPCFPLMRAPLARTFALPELGGVQAGIVRWPASVVRLRAADRARIHEAACHVLDTWRSFSDEGCGIVAATPTTGPDGAATLVPHNTLNPILHREDGDYVMDLVLRNNRTTPERPFGLFHPDESLFHIKKENIGLIEIMGRAILPARLASELPAVKGECDRAFYQILVATGVFKDDAAGRAGWDRFLAALGAKT